MNDSTSKVDLREVMGQGAVATLYSRVRGLNGARAGISAFIAGALSNLSFAPVYFWPALMVGLSFLVWLLDGATRQPKPRFAGFWRVFCFGIGLFGVGFHWVGFAFLVNPGAHLALIWLAALLPIGLALIWGGVAWLMMNWWNAGPARALLLAISLFAAEWIRGHLFGGFPWNLPGMVWGPGGAISQSASLFGIYGLSLLTLIAFTAPAAMIDTRPGIGAKGGSAGRAGLLVASALVFGVVWGWGAQRLGEAQTQLTDTQIRLVDAGAPQDEKFEQHNLVLRRYRELTGADLAGEPDLVIWPEAALPYMLIQDPGALDVVTSILGDRKLIAGTLFEDDQLIPQKFYNALVVVDSESSTRSADQIYYKHRLVPFGEFVPFRSIAALIGINALQQIATEGLFPGPAPSAMRSEGMPDFEPLICYEALFSGLLPRRMTEDEVAAEYGLDPNAQWIVNISIDAWFGPLWAPYQHMEHARYRAIEEGLPLVRVASRGTSGVIDAYGRITALAQAPENDPSNPQGWNPRVLDAKIPSSLEPTVFSRWRSALMWLMTTASIAFGLVLLPRD